MPGLVLNVIPKTTYDFADIDVGVSQVIPLGEPIDILQYTRFSIIIRVHDLQIAPSNVLNVGFYADGFIDGNIQFVPPLVHLFSRDLTSSTVAPTLLTVLGMPACYPVATIAMQATRAVVGTMKASISVDVHMTKPDIDQRSQRFHGLGYSGIPAPVATGGGGGSLGGGCSVKGEGIVSGNMVGSSAIDFYKEAQRAATNAVIVKNLAGGTGTTQPAQLTTFHPGQITGSPSTPTLAPTSDDDWKTRWRGQ
jgi:hypothetical protein